MRVIVKESFSTAKGDIQAGAIIDIPEKMLESLREKVEPLSFEPLHWQREMKELSEEMTANDPGGAYWEQVKESHPETWRDFITTEQQIDVAYQEQNAAKIVEAIARTRATFTGLIEAWSNRYDSREV